MTFKLIEILLISDRRIKNGTERDTQMNEKN